MISSLPWLYSAYAVAGLSTLLLREGISLFCTFHEAKISQGGLQLGITMDRRLSSLLLFLIILEQLVANYWFASSPQTWVHTIQPLELASEGLTRSCRPVFVIRYIEWICSVPLMLLLAGVCALGRPLKEVLGPIVVTEMYIFLSWAANIVQSSALHWMLVTVTLISYCWASMGMFGWVSRFWLSVPSDVPSPEIRAAVILGLVALFALHAIVYLLAQADAISVGAEHLSYTFLDFSSKVVMSFTFSRVQSADCWQTLHSLATYLENLNTGMMSILRANFDFVVPCVADSSGWCHLQSCDSPDVKEFGRILGRDIAGLSLGELIAPEDHDRFAAYVQNTLNQSQIMESTAHSLQSKGSPQLPRQAPIASVLQFSMLSWQNRGDNAQEFVTQAAPWYVAVIVHLSVVRPAGPKQLAHVIAAFRLAPEDSSQMPAAALQAHQQLDAFTDFNEVSKKVKDEDEQSENTVMPLDSASNLGSSDACQMLQVPHCSIEANQVQHGSVDKADETLCSTRSPSQQRCAPGNLNHQQSTRTSNFDLEADGDVGIGGSDVGSQSSKLSFVGSITLACQQLLGPLHSGLPPKEVTPKAIEDHVHCAADMMRRKVPVEIARLYHQQKLAEWKDKSKAHSLSQILVHGRAPDKIDTQIWRSLVLPALTEKSPGVRPKEPNLPDDNELWRQSWDEVMGEDEQDSDEENNPLAMFVLPPWQTYPARHPRSQ